MQLRCFDPNCAVTLDLHAPALGCPKCGGLLEVDVAQTSVDAKALKALWSERRKSRDPRDISGVWRYREFLPEYPAQIQAVRSLDLSASSPSVIWAGPQPRRFQPAQSLVRLAIRA